MITYTLIHLDDDAVMQGFAAHRARDRHTYALLLVDIAEIDARHLYLRAGFESMKAFCVRELSLSEDAAAKRIQVARLARELPALISAIADGRLTLFTVRLLAPRLTPANVEELIEEASHKPGTEIELLLARRFPQAEPMRLDDGIVPQVTVPQRPTAIEHAARHAHVTAPIVDTAQKVRTRIAPLSPERYTLQVTLLAETHDRLRRVQELLGHAVPTGDVSLILHRALGMMLDHLEKRKFGASSRPRKPRPAATRRCVPAHVRRAVYERDSGRCAYLGESGLRCRSVQRLGFDHIVPVARGGRSTAENLRLLCRAHNQFEAERAFGRKFIHGAKTIGRRQ